jgi:aryl-alcohol dehydrogenase-like predicted oxidoreductase
VIVGNKVGAGRGPDGSWIVVDAPGTIRRQVHEALEDLGTDTSELTYLRLGGDYPGPESDVPLEDRLGTKNPAHLRANIAAAEIAEDLIPTEVDRLTGLADESRAILDQPHQSTLDTLRSAVRKAGQPSPS